MEVIVVIAVLGIAAVLVANKMGWLPDKPEEAEPVKPEPVVPKAAPKAKKKIGALGAVEDQA